jgi:hypothetical protein
VEGDDRKANCEYENTASVCTLYIEEGTKDDVLSWYRHTVEAVRKQNCWLG